MMNGHHLESYFGHECYNEANCVDGRQQYPNLCKYLQVPNVGQCFSVAFSPITTFFYGKYVGLILSEQIGDILLRIRKSFQLRSTCSAVTLDATREMRRSCALKVIIGRLIN